MTTVRHIDQIDTVAFWPAVVGVLVESCGFNQPKAAQLVSTYRRRLAGQSDSGHLLIYHQSVADVAYDIWRAERNDGVHDPDFRNRLVESDAERHDAA